MSRLESEIVEDLIKSRQFRSLVKTYGIKSLRLVKREKHVANGGPKRTRGRIDLLYNTDIGCLVIEVQRGKSDNDHYERFADYLSNFSSGKCLGLVWVAEEFTDMHLYMCQTSDNPILPIKAQWNGKRYEYKLMLDFVECFGTYEMARVSHTIATNARWTEEARRAWQPKTLREIFNSRNPVAGHLMRLLDSKMVYPSGLTGFELEHDPRNQVSAATLRRLHSALSSHNE